MCGEFIPLEPVSRFRVLPADVLYFKRGCIIGTDATYELLMHRVRLRKERAPKAVTKPRTRRGERIKEKLKRKARVAAGLCGFCGAVRESYGYLCDAHEEQRKQRVKAARIRHDV